MVRTTSILASMLATATSQSSVGSISSRAECQWHVRDQTITVEAPVIYDVPVATSCPRDDFGAMHDDICTDCDALDNECGGEFVACAGCCQLPKEARYHSCTNIKKYFFEKNSKSVACDARMDLSDGDVNVEYGEQTTQRENSGNLVSTCDVPVIKAAAEGVPVKLQFDCTACATQGVPHLLRQCCDKAAGFKDSTMIRKLQDDDFTVFMWAAGCHDRWIGRDGSIEFTDTYPELTESAINQQMDTFIEDEYCSKSRKPSSDTCPQRRLRESNFSWLSDAGESNSSRPRILNGEDCPWLSDPKTSESSATGALTAGNEAGNEDGEANLAAGLSAPWAAMLAYGGITYFA